MATFEELLAGTKPPTNVDEILTLAREMLCVDELDEDDRAGFACGFSTGAGWALAMHMEDRARECAQRLIQLQSEWAAHDIL